MPKYWCVNFETEANLQHGIDNCLWMMGYQYADDQNDPPARKAAITRNWRKLQGIAPGDRFVAYLPRNRFFATGIVRPPRRSKTRQDKTDTIKAYLDRGESYESGFVYFASSVVYENFTDQCDNYPVRVDVEEWSNYVPAAVSVAGLDLPRHKTVNAAFSIDKRLFDKIAKALASGHGSMPNGDKADITNAGEDEAAIEALERSYAKSQGFQLDSKTRKAIEDYAMRAATKHFKTLGYSVEDHSKNHSYDLLCMKKKERLYVEVKGTVTTGDSIILTNSEVKFARSHKGEMGLFILHSLQVSADGKLSNGEPKVIVPWDVDEGNLKPVAFVYEVPA